MMITKSEENQIRDYLLDKKLPIDILLEVNDHFIAQISDLQHTKNIDFKAAFELTKISWKEELTTYFPWYVLNKTNAVARTRFEQKIRRKANINLFRLSFPISLIVFLILFFIAEFTSKDQFLKYFQIIFMPIIIFPLLFFIYNIIFNSFAFKKIHNNYKFSIYQWQVFFIGSFGYWGMEYIKPINIFITTFKNNDFSLHFITQILMLFVLILANIYAGITQIKLAKTLKKIKPQLQFT